MVEADKEPSGALLHLQPLAQFADSLVKLETLDSALLEPPAPISPFSVCCYWHISAADFYHGWLIQSALGR